MIIKEDGKMVDKDIFLYPIKTPMETIEQIRLKLKNKENQFRVAQCLLQSGALTLEEFIKIYGGK